MSIDAKCSCGGSLAMSASDNDTIEPDYALHCFRCESCGSEYEIEYAPIEINLICEGDS